MNPLLGTFSTMLSEFGKYLQDKASRTVYFPLGIVLLSLASIIGFTVGWDTINTFWKSVPAESKLVLSIAAVLIFLFLAYVLSGLQGIVSQMFQGTVLAPLFRITGHLTQHRSAWETSNVHWKTLTTLSNVLKEAHAELEAYGLRRDVVVATQAVGQYHLITTGEIVVKEVPVVDKDAFRRLESAVGTVTRKALRIGDQLTTRDVLQLPHSRYLVGRQFVPVAVLPHYVPSRLAAGNLVNVYDNVAGTLLSSEPLLVMDLEASSQTGAGGVVTNLLRLMLAAPPTSVSAILASAGSGSLVFTLPPSENVVPVNPPQQLPLAPPSITASETVRIPLSGKIKLEKRIDSINLLLFDENDPYSIKHFAFNCPMHYNTGEHGPQYRVEVPGDLAEVLRNATQLEDELETIEEALQKEQTKAWVEALRSKPPDEMAESAYAHHARKVLALIKLVRESYKGPDRLKLVNRVSKNRLELITLLKDGFEAVEHRIDRIRQYQRLYYPYDPNMLAPTAIGNIFRALDSYCNDLYGLDATLVLPRLRGVLEKPTLDMLSAAEERLALLQWSWLGVFTIGLLGGSILALGNILLWGLAIWVVALLLVVFVIYPAAVAAALDYAQTLRVAFDRERGKVLDAIGIGDQVPVTVSTKLEKALWQKAGEWWQYGRAPGEYKLMGSSAATKAQNKGGSNAE